MKTDELIDAVVTWGKSHGIDNIDRQGLKFFEEAGEICTEICHGRLDDPEGKLKDSLGDTLVTLIIWSDILGYDLRDCLQAAYDEIKSREGTTIEGCFIKNDQ